MQIHVDDIIVTDRYRQDLGDLTELADSIQTSILSPKPGYVKTALANVTGALLLIACLAVAFSPLFPTIRHKHHIADASKIVATAETPSPSFANFFSINFKVDIAPKGFSTMPISDITQGYKLTTPTVTSDSADFVMTVTHGTSAYTQLATWVAYRVAYPVAAPLFLMGSDEVSDYFFNSTSGYANVTLTINGSVIGYAGGGPGAGVYINPPGTYNAGNCYGGIAGNYTVPVRGGFDFVGLLSALDGVHDVILTLPQTTGSCYFGKTISLTILPDAQVSGVPLSDLWTNIGAATSPITSRRKIIICNWS